MSHLARCSLEGHNRHVVSFPVCPSPSKFSIIARTCLVPLETFGRILKGLLILPTTQRNLHVSLPVSPNLNKNCSPRVHSRSEAVESRESMTFSVSIRKPSVVKKPSRPFHRYPLSCGLECRLQALGTEPKGLSMCTLLAITIYKCHPYTPCKQTDIRKLLRGKSGLLREMNSGR
jgi:hypothetical protein